MNIIASNAMARSPWSRFLRRLCLLGGAVSLLAAGLAYAGSMITATCPCGYEKSMAIFGGRANFQTHCAFPALCSVSGEMILVNVLDPDTPPKECPEGGFTLYSDPTLRQGEEGETVVSWYIKSQDRVLLLTDAAYLCPQCREYRLRFRLTGMWD